MKVLLTGCQGQLGSEMVLQAASHRVIAVGRAELDIRDAAAVQSVVDSVEPDVIVNAAAYTAVDHAEEDAAAAFAVNRDGSLHLATACEKLNIPLIHISTDYVFDGSKAGAYIESDPVSPLGVYGESKLAGEQAVLNGCPQSIVLRTSWVFSSHGNNFVKTMLRLGAEREELGIVADQHGCPTSAAELARAIYAVLAHELGDEYWGVYHMCQPKPTTWFEFAEAVFEQGRSQGLNIAVNSVRAISTADYPTAAQRPANSVMDCSKFEETFDFTIRPWRDSLNEVVKELSTGN